MKILLLTVAGMSTRFSKSLGSECLKCIYFEKDMTESLLYRALRKNESFDKFIIVGGYKFDALKSYVDTYLKELKDKIVLLENPKFKEYGSGYSLYLGIEYAVNIGFDELIFAEGDLWVDKESFDNVLLSGRDAVTFNREIISSDKSVVYYFDSKKRIHYLYDLAHNSLEIKEPFISIYNSAQIWKFTSLERVAAAVDDLSQEEWQSTNLVFIQKYFGELNPNEFDLIEIRKWINCNTVSDFYRIEQEHI